MTHEPSDDRRRHVRRDQCLAIKIFVSAEENPTSQPYDQSTTRNLSEGGALFDSEKPLQVGQKLQLSLEVPQEAFSLWPPAQLHYLAEVIRLEKADQHGLRRDVAVRFLKKLGLN